MFYEISGNILLILMILYQKRLLSRRTVQEESISSVLDLPKYQVCACVITCGGLCPGLNTMIREIVCALHHMEDTKLTTFKIVVYIIGGDGTQKGAAVIYEEIRRRGIKAVVVRIPKTIDNDISVIDRESRKRHRSSQINSALQRVHCNVCNSCKS
ncbi:unnamed protein product [Lactuca virosa]|uniref:Phosphofructokinase domain-containing protein n=1 Tax=Lactuca virosa TaxID=75947 RepID=A0AAU9N3B1_9ASTR|nr:unnamed protein product [Lactuca virosa]